jgi:hypothetical protein
LGAEWLTNTTDTGYLCYRLIKETGFALLVRNNLLISSHPFTLIFA